jgi:hypothetical protein
MGLHACAPPICSAFVWYAPPSQQGSMTPGQLHQALESMSSHGAVAHGRWWTDGRLGACACWLPEGRRLSTPHQVRQHRDHSAHRRGMGGTAPVGPRPTVAGRTLLPLELVSKRHATKHAPPEGGYAPGGRLSWGVGHALLWEHYGRRCPRRDLCARAHPSCVAGHSIGS